jgi:4-carboxymuconolactone decarboxylase
MPPSDRARKNHEELFPNHKSTLKVTDPELIEVFDNFAFDEVIAQSKLDTKTRVMLILAAIIGANGFAEFKVMAGAALNVGVTPVQLKEIVYQSVPYVGMAKAFDFIHATNDVLTGRGIQLPVEGQSTTDTETRREKGLAVQKAIFGNMIDELYERSPKDQLHIQRFLSANCFGDYYTRTGLDINCRELVTLSILIALGGTESQVKGHIRGNVNVGNGRKVLLDVITQLLPWVGYPRTLNALGALNEVAPEQ